MKIAIMQPYFFPYLGYFALIKHTDLWIVFDTPQFIRHGWIERNRILKPVEGWQYIKVPLVKHKRETSINEILIKTNENWQNKILAQLIHYKKKAPYYFEILNLVKHLISYKTSSIVNLNIHILKGICEYLNINFNYKIYSAMKLQIEKVNEPDEWALYISKALKAHEYVNLTGGINFFNKNKFNKENIKLTFLDINLMEYEQKNEQFEKGLSIIDALMFNSAYEIKYLLDQFNIY